MALTATIYNLEVQLADMDRGVYESLAFYLNIAGDSLEGTVTRHALV